ncbi:MAG TPA: methyl-accepting chemotaxis protein [Pyrinomonadaceae bacterium]|nr:methyl-accepting chemotaxis protein [Pyrinomonadaceae bacterium]
MQINSIWDPIVKFVSALAILLSIVAAVAACTSFFGWSEKRFGVVAIAIIFAAGLTVFSIIELIFTELSLKRERRQAIEIATKLANGEFFDEDVDERSELLSTLKQIAEYRKNRSAILEKIAAGNLAEDVELTSEFDAVGKTYQNAVEKLRLSVQTQEARDQLQSSVLKLLGEVREVAAGDLTVQAQVSPEMTGAIAEAFNSMTVNFRTLISQVKDVTFQVGASANSVNDTTEQLARGSEAQAAQISRTTSAVSQMTLQIQEVSQNASLSAQVAGDSLGNARYGTQAVQDNINAMNAIRKQVQETAKRIKRLGERSQEISQIVELIDDLSNRTSLLALNASLQASQGGEAGRGFAVVAEEVERLAERSNRLTRQIAELAQTIQAETKDVVASMEETIHEVVVGSTLADRAGQALVEIEQVSTRLAELIQSISESAQRQATSSEDISRAMASIAKVTELVQNGSKQAADSMKNLLSLSDELSGSVASFKLPDDRRRKLTTTEAGGVYVN